RETGELAGSAEGRHAGKELGAAGSRDEAKVARTRPAARPASPSPITQPPLAKKEAPSDKPAAGAATMRGRTVAAEPQSSERQGEWRERADYDDSLAVKSKLAQSAKGDQLGATAAPPAAAEAERAAGAPAVATPPPTKRGKRAYTEEMDVARSNR